MRLSIRGGSSAAAMHRGKARQHDYINHALPVENGRGVFSAGFSEMNAGWVLLVRAHIGLRIRSTRYR
jgi:hypothetical protein